MYRVQREDDGGIMGDPNPNWIHSWHVCNGRQGGRRGREGGEGGGPNDNDVGVAAADARKPVTSIQAEMDGRRLQGLLD